jgi:hypothetical protein
MLAWSDIAVIAVFLVVVNGLKPLRSTGQPETLARQIGLSVSRALQRRRRQGWTFDASEFNFASLTGL